MPFKLATFQQYLTTANSHYSRVKESSMTPLETALALWGAAVPVPGNRIPVIPAGFALAANIQTYGRVISRG